MVVSPGAPHRPVPSPGAGDDEAASTRNALLDAVIHIAGTQGLEKVTYRSVAAHAGLSHSLVRFYFGSGDVMLAEALERAAHLDAAEGHLRAADVESFGSAFVESISGANARGLLQYDYLLRAVRGGIPLERVVALYDYYIQEVAGTLDNLHIEDPDGSIATLVFAALDGLVLQHAVYGSDDRTEAVLARLRDVLRGFQQG